MPPVATTKKATRLRTTKRAELRLPFGSERQSTSGMGTARRLHTSLRCRTAAQTIAHAQRLMLRLGVTQVFDATPLDHLGLPVFMSVRPGGSTIRVHSGKGMLPDDAHAGAWMEAVEYAACESGSKVCATERRTLSQLRQQWPPGLTPVDFAPRLGASVGRRTRLASVECEILGTRRSTFLPAELVLMPAPKQRAQGLFASSSNGLASGNTLSEATLHAILEVLERDTVALHTARDESQFVLKNSLPAPFSGLRLRWARRGVRLIVRHLPNAAGLPCFEAALHEPDVDPSMLLARGWGMHFDRQMALSRAICEAAQSRLAVILSQHPELSGSNEMAKRLAPGADPEKTAQLLTRLKRAAGEVRFEALPDLPCPSISDALRQLLSRLAGAGLGPVFRKRLHLDGDSSALCGLHVVKVVVARSETANGKEPRIGSRLFARIQGA